MTVGFKKYVEFKKEMGDNNSLNKPASQNAAKPAGQPANGVVQRNVAANTMRPGVVAKPLGQPNVAGVGGKVGGYVQNGNLQIKSAVVGTPILKKTTTVTTTSSVTKPSVETAQIRPLSSSGGVNVRNDETKAIRPKVNSSQYINLQPKITNQQLDPIIQERRLWNLNNVLIAFVIGAILVTIEFVAVPILELQPTSGIILALVLLVIYAVILFFLLEPKVLREVKYTNIRTVETPVVREVPVDREVIRTVEKPVYKEVIKTVQSAPVIRTIEKPVYRTIEKPVYRTIEKPVIRTVTRNVVKFKERPKLNIPHYNFTGSTETKVYHTTNCRLGKLVKRKYALHANTEEFFKRRKFRPCEVCILKNKKI